MGSLGPGRMEIGDVHQDNVVYIQVTIKIKAERIS